MRMLLCLLLSAVGTTAGSPFEDCEAGRSTQARDYTRILFTEIGPALASQTKYLSKLPGAAGIRTFTAVVFDKVWGKTSSQADCWWNAVVAYIEEKERSELKSELQSFKSKLHEVTEREDYARMENLRGDVSDHQHNYFKHDKVKSTFRFMNLMCGYHIAFLETGMVYKEYIKNEKDALLYRMNLATAIHNCIKFAYWGAHRYEEAHHRADPTLIQARIDDFSPDNLLEMLLLISPAQYKMALKDLETLKIKHYDQVGLMIPEETYGFTSPYWLSCWGSGNECHDRGCTHCLEDEQKCAVQHFFRQGYQYDWGRDVECRGEVFWLQLISRGSFKSGDEGGLMYSWKGGDDYYWFSCDTHKCKTRTCPGNNVDNLHRCYDEKFQFHAVGKSPGDEIQSGDVIHLRRAGTTLRVDTYKNNAIFTFRYHHASFCVNLKIFKIDSMLNGEYRIVKEDLVQDLTHRLYYLEGREHRDVSAIRTAWKCHEECKKWASCRAWNWFGDHVCRLFTYAIQTRDDVWPNYIRSGIVEDIKNFVMETDMSYSAKNYVGGLIFPLWYVIQPSHCFTLCEANPKCVAWQYDIDGRPIHGWMNSIKCWLFSDVTAKAPLTLQHRYFASGMISGRCDLVKLCPPPVVQCGGNLTVIPGASGQLLTSPNYPKAYPDEMDCYWFITASSGHRVKLHFETMEMDPDGDDVVGVYKGHIKCTESVSCNPLLKAALISVAYGTKSGFDVVSPDKYMTVNFYSDYGGPSHKGFQARVYAV